jgi:anti-sigma-K factor RskA
MGQILLMIVAGVAAVVAALWFQVPGWVLVVALAACVVVLGVTVDVRARVRARRRPTAPLSLNVDKPKTDEPVVRPVDED